MAEDPGYYFGKRDGDRIANAVLRNKKRPINQIQPWRARKICRQGTKDISWALTPPGNELLIAPVANCMIAGTPNAGEYGDDQFGYADVGGFWTYCAGLFPNQWYPIHTSVNYFICGGAWSLTGTADTGCDRGDYCRVNIGAIGPGATDGFINGVHSPAGDIEAGSLVYLLWKGGVGEYAIVLDECSGT